MEILEAKDYTLGIRLNPEFTFHTYVTKNTDISKNVGELNTILSIIPNTDYIERFDGIVDFDYMNPYRLIIKKKSSFDWKDILDPLMNFFTEDIDAEKSKVLD